MNKTRNTKTTKKQSETKKNPIFNNTADSGDHFEVLWGITWY